MAAGEHIEQQPVHRRPKRRALVITLVAAVLLGSCTCLGGGGTLIWWYQRTQRQSAIDATLTWARLDPLPSSTRNLMVDVRGTTFTREFVVTFQASPGDLHAWLAASPGTSQIVPVIDGPWLVYSIQPGGGAQFAEVRLDVARSLVQIHTYWS